MVPVEFSELKLLFSGRSVHCLKSRLDVLILFSLFEPGCSAKRHRTVNDAVYDIWFMIVIAIVYS